MATETTKLTYVEGAAASTPAASRVVTYAKADGLMYSKDDAGTETLMSSKVGSLFDYVEFTSNVNVTATTEGTANTVVSGTSLTFENRAYWIEFYSPAVKAANTANAELYLLLYEDSTILGYIGGVITPESAGNDRPVLVRRKRTPTAASHQYHVKAIVSSGTGIVKGGAGGTGAFLPGYIAVYVA